MNTDYSPVRDGLAERPQDRAAPGRQAAPLGDRPVTEARRERAAKRGNAAALGLVVAAAGLWACIFAGLALLRHASGGTNAQDLGFTDQVIWNFLHGQWFRMSLYIGATEWNTEMALASLAQPESLLAFHFEPMLLLLVPIYAAGGDARHLLVLQSIAFALGAIPAYLLGARWSGSAWAGAAVAAAYLLSPIGQWAMLADFHTTALAAPLLVLAIERVAAGRSVQGSAAAFLAATAREDAALAVAAVGLFVLLTGRIRPGVAILGIGAAGAALSFAVIDSQSGGSWAFAPRYLGLESGPEAVIAALSRPEVTEFVATTLLSGGLLAALVPTMVLPILPLAALNAVSSSPWMAAGRAHYSVLVLPLLVAGAAWTLRRLATLRAPRPELARRAGALALVTGACIAHLWIGVGPLGANYAPSLLTEHSDIAAAMSYRIPPDAAVSASSGLVPRVSRRANVYLFPVHANADYIFLDIAGNTAPTSPGDAYLRVQGLLSAGGWHVEAADDGLLLLRRRPGTPSIAPRDLPARFLSFARGARSARIPAEPTLFDVLSHAVVPPPALAQSIDTPKRFTETNLELLGGDIYRAPDDTLAVDGVRGLLRTTWRATGPVPRGTWIEIDVRLIGDREARVSDIAATWWYPPERWALGEEVRLEVAVPLRGLTGWSARVRTPDPS